MSPAAVDVLLFRLHGHRLAVNLHLVSSVLDPEEAEGMALIDPRPHLLVGDTNPGELTEPDDDQRVGLLNLAGPPTVVLLGEVLGAEKLTAEHLLVLPDWLAGMMPPVFEPACAWLDENVVWLLDLDTLNQTPST